MKLEQMILVIKNEKGVETNYLSSLADYMQTLEQIYPEFIGDRADAVARLYETLQREDDWVGESSQSHEIYTARFCGSIQELQKFLQGRFRESDVKAEKYLNEKYCSDGCLEVLQAYGLDAKGNEIPNAFVYEQIKHVLPSRGEQIKNFEGEAYRVLEALNKRDYLLMSEKSGDVMMACGLEQFRRAPKAEYKSMDSVQYGVKWKRSIYLGNQISTIDFKQVKREYAGIENRQKKAGHKLPVPAGPKL